MANSVEVACVVVGRRGCVGGEVRVEGQAVGNLVEAHLQKQEKDSLTMKPKFRNLIVMTSVVGIWLGELTKIISEIVPRRLRRSRMAVEAI